MHVILNGEPLEEVDCFKYFGSQVAADGGCQKDEVHRMNEGSSEKCPEQQRIGDKGKEVSIRRSNCTSGVVRSRGMAYEKC